MSEPTTPAPDARDEQPGGAVIEIVERHQGTKKSYTGHDSIIIPNHMRINGVAIFATEDAPATIHETVIDGSRNSLFTVTVQVLARGIHVGATPSFNPDSEAPDADQNSAAMIEIPDVDSWADDDRLERPWVLLNGHRLWTAGELVVSGHSTHAGERTIAMVTIPLLCRQFIVDDEPALPAAPYDNGGVLPLDPGAVVNTTGVDEPIA